MNSSRRKLYTGRNLIKDVSRAFGLDIFSFYGMTSLLHAKETSYKQKP